MKINQLKGTVVLIHSHFLNPGDYDQEEGEGEGHVHIEFRWFVMVFETFVHP